MEEWRYSSIILNFSTRWRRVASLTPRPLYLPVERAPDTHWIGGSMNLIAVLDAIEERKT
jgi:hypothetical protein